MRVVLLLTIVAAVRIYFHCLEKDGGERLCARFLSGERVVVEGAFVRITGGVRLSRPKLQMADIETIFPGDVTVFQSQIHFPRKGTFRREGEVRCSFAPRNPGEFRALRFQRLRARALGVGRVAVLKERSDRLHRWFFRFPRLLEFQRGLWQGEWDWLESDVYAVYKNGGLLHLLALSGQHVVVLIGLVQFLSRTVLNFLPSRCASYHFQLQRLFPLLIASFLCFTSSGAPSMLRALACVASQSLLRVLRLKTSLLQRLTTAIAILIILDPELVGSIGFVLSAVATIWVGQDLICFCARDGWQGYVALTLKMSLCLMPLSAYYFYAVPVAAPVLNLLIVWLWELVLLPLGFLIPLLFFLLPKPAFDVVGNGWEAAWHSFEMAHRSAAPFVEKTYTLVPALNLAECAVVQIALFHCFFVNKKFK